MRIIRGEHYRHDSSDKLYTVIGVAKHAAYASEEELIVYHERNKAVSLLIITATEFYKRFTHEAFNHCGHCNKKAAWKHGSLNWGVDDSYCCDEHKFPDMMRWTE